MEEESKIINPIKLALKGKFIMGIEGSANKVGIGKPVFYFRYRRRRRQHYLQSQKNLHHPPGNWVLAEVDSRTSLRKYHTSNHQSPKGGQYQHQRSYR